MNRLRLAVLSLALSTSAFAQVQVTIAPPSIQFAAPPPVVVVQPGVQVVEDRDEEIFLVDGAYWVRHGGRWFRAHDHRGGWVVVDGRGVPAALVQMPPGRYRHYRRGKTVVVNPPGPGKIRIHHR